MNLRASLVLPFAILVTAPAAAADSTQRTYADPACSERNADPDKCVLATGPARSVNADDRAPPNVTPTKPDAPASGAMTPGGTPGATIGGGFTPKTKK
jgi:hypothetical protein